MGPKYKNVKHVGKSDPSSEGTPKKEVFGGVLKNKKHVFDPNKAVVLPENSEDTFSTGPKAKLKIHGKSKDQ